jgi:hypothetical protein
MRAEGTFSVAASAPTDVVPVPAVTTAMQVGVMTMEKRYEGDVAGRSATLFTSAYDPAAGAGTYVALEAFEGSIGGRRGTFNFVHSATTTGSDRRHELFLIVPASGTGDLAGITGAGGLRVDDDGTHRVWFDYDLP